MDPSDPGLSKSDLLISTIPLRPVGAASILNPLRIRGSRNCSKAAPPAKKTCHRHVASVTSITAGIKLCEKYPPPVQHIYRG